MQIRCRCDNAVELDAPSSIDLDADAASLNALLDGSFLSVTCPQCGAHVRPEIALRVTWPSRGLDVQVLPELERLSALRGKIDAPKGKEVLIGYPELFERVRMLRDGLDPKAVETLKYFVFEKAEDADPEADIDVLYHGSSSDYLSFHILGLKKDEAAVLKLPCESYKKAVSSFKDTASREPFKSVFSGAYKSIKKLAFLESSDE